MDATQYSFEDFIAYVMIFAAEADFEISEEERAYIVSKVGAAEYDKMLALFESHNDIEVIEFILELEKIHVMEGEESDLLQLVKEVMFSDHEFDTLEQNTLIALERLNRHR